MFVITHKNRDHIGTELSNNGIPTGIHYPIPIHKHQCFADCSFTQGKNFPVAEKQADELLSLPMHPNLSQSEIEFISKKLIDLM